MRLLVTGMHRSGTSLFARLLNECGFYLGEASDFHPSDQANPAGYWEHKEFQRINESLLREAGATWNRPQDFSLMKIPDTSLKQIQAEAKSVVAKLDDQANWLVKDPRFCLTIPFWDSILSHYSVVAVSRDPVQVAESLRNRNSFPIQYGLAIWEYYIRSLVKNTQFVNFELVQHSHLISHPEQVLGDLLNSFTNWGSSDLRVPKQSDISKIVDQKLFRATGKGIVSSDYMMPSQSALAEALGSGDYHGLASGPSSLAAKDQLSQMGTLLDLGARELNVVNQVLLDREQEITQLKEYTASLQTVIDEKEIDLKIAGEYSNEQELSVANLVKERDSALEQANQLKESLVIQEEESSQLLEKIDTNERMINDLTLEARRKSESIDSIQQGSRTLTEHISSLNEVLLRKDSELEEAATALGEYQAALEDSRDHASNLTKSVAELEKYIDSLSKSLKSKESELAANQIEFQKINSELVEASKYAGDLEKTLAERTEYVESLLEALTQKEKELLRFQKTS